MRNPILAAIILTLAVVASVCAQEGPPNAAPSATAKGRGTVGKLNGQQKTDNSKQNTSPCDQVPACNCCPTCCPIEQPHTQSEEDKAKAASFDLLYRRYLGATIIGVMGAFIGLIILICQTVYLKRSIEVPQRAWIIAKVVKPIENLTAWQVPRVRVELINTGHTPAFKCSYETWSIIGDRNTELIPADASYYKVPFPTTIYQNSVPVEIFPIRTNNPLTPEQFAGLQTGDVRIVFRIRVEYVDAFKKAFFFKRKHFAEFGYTVSETAMGALPHYNRAD